MGKKMKTVPRPASEARPQASAQASGLGAALAQMGTAFMPNMGQATTAPPKIPPPILPPGQGPMQRPSSKPSKRFIKKMGKPLPPPRKKASSIVADAGKGKRPAMKDKMSETVDKEQRKQIDDILPKKQRA